MTKSTSTLRRGPEHEEIIKRIINEVSDHALEQKKLPIDQLEVEVDDLFADAEDDFCKPELILQILMFGQRQIWIHIKMLLLVSKIMGPIIRTETTLWNPLNEDHEDFENMNWYSTCMLYGLSKKETDESLLVDPDIKQVPTIIEKIVLPKVTGGSIFVYVNFY